MAVMQSGTIFRNVGRPRLSHWEDHVVVGGAAGETQRVPIYTYPLSIDLQPDGRRGYDLDAMEYQGRCFKHGHRLWRPAVMPIGWDVLTPNVQLPWVDAFTCARIPDRSVLVQFKLLGLVSEWRVLDGVCRTPDDASNGVFPCYTRTSVRSRRT
eukprot:2244840-Prymnesium_polylepis.2